MRYAALTLLLLLPGCLGQCQAVGGGAMGGGGGGAIRWPTYTPASDPTPPGAPTHWYAAWKETGFADNDPVATAQDFGSAGLDATQGTADSRPTWQENRIGGQPTFFGDGTDDFLRTAATSSVTQTFTTCAVFAYAAVSGFSTSEAITDGSSTASGFVGAHNTGAVRLLAGSNGTSSLIMSLTEAHWVCATFDGASTTVTLDGADATVDPGTGGLDGVTLFTRASGAGSGVYMGGDIAEVIVWDTPITHSDFGTYASERYGATWPK